MEPLLAPYHAPSPGDFTAAGCACMRMHTAGGRVCVHVNICMCVLCQCMHTYLCVQGECVVCTCECVGLVCIGGYEHRLEHL